MREHERCQGAGKRPRRQPKKSPEMAKRREPVAPLAFSLSIDPQRHQGPRDSCSVSRRVRPGFPNQNALTGDNATSRVVYVGRRVLRRLGGRGEGGRSLVGRDSGKRPRGCFRDRPRGRGPPASSSEHAAALSRGRGRRGRARTRRESGDGTTPGSEAAGLRDDKDARRRRRRRRRRIGCRRENERRLERRERPLEGRGDHGVERRAVSARGFMGCKGRARREQGGDSRKRRPEPRFFFFLSSPARPRGKEWLEESDGEERSEERKFAKKTSSSLILLVVSFSPSSHSRFPNPHVFSLEAL